MSNIHLQRLYNFFYACLAPQYAQPVRFFDGLLAALLLVLLVNPSVTFAWPPTYGPEFEFTNDFVATGESARGLRGHEHIGAEKMAALIELRCPVLGCKKSLVDGKWGKEYRFEFPNEDFWFQISWDPKVVEVTAKPATLEKLRHLQPLLQDAIFESARISGLHVDPRTTAGHFNYGARATFADNTENFFRYFLDYANRPELALGIFRKNLNTAPPLSVLKEKQRQALLKVTEEFRSHRQMGFIKRFLNRKDLTITGLAKKIQDQVYTEAYTPQFANYHNQALGLKKVAKPFSGDQPMEERATRAQRDMEDFLLRAEILEARVAYLKTLPASEALIYTATARTEFSNRELASRFYIYLQEMGLSYEKYQRLLIPEVQSAGLDAFILNRGFWTSEEYVASLKSHLDLIPSSPWARKKIQGAFKHPSAQGSDAAQAVLQQIQQMAKDSNLPPQVRESHGRFYQSLPDLRKSLPGLMRACRNVFQY